MSDHGSISRLDKLRTLTEWLDWQLGQTRNKIRELEIQEQQDKRRQEQARAELSCGTKDDSPRSTGAPTREPTSTSTCPPPGTRTLNADSDYENPSQDLSTWTIERLQAFASDTQGRQLEAVRVVAQGHAYRADEPREARQQWAKLSLQANQRLHGDSLRDRARATQQNFMLRIWMIDQLGPDDEDPDWSPEKLAADTVTALGLPPTEARALADHWRDLAVEQIGELRRHKNLTVHLDRLVNHLQPSPVRDQVLAWTETRQHLP